MLAPCPNESQQILFLSSIRKTESDTVREDTDGADRHGVCGLNLRPTDFGVRGSVHIDSSSDRCVQARTLRDLMLPSRHLHAVALSQHISHKNTDKQLAGQL
jgi:hypothetical protein